MKIVIDEDVTGDGEMQSLLEYVQSLVAQGYTSGYYPHWHIED